MTRIITFILILSIIIPSISQENLNPDIFGVRTHYGFIIPHSSNLKEISKSNPFGIQIEWSRLKNSNNAWENCNCYARTGFSFTYFNYGNPDQLGSSYNLIYFAEPYFSYKSQLFYSLRAGGGITYLNQVYDEKTNPENLFYSSPISFLLLLALNVNYNLNDQFILTASANYNHISNGGMKPPNKGMNFPTFGFGLSYSPHLEPLRVREKTSINKGLLRGYLRLFGTLPGTGETDNLPDERKLLLGLAGGAMYFLTHTNAVNAGIEAVYDGSLKEKFRRSGDSYDHHIIGAMVGNNFIFGKLTFNQQFGFYLYKSFPSSHNNFYQRYELLYQLTEHFQIGTSLKAHGHVADNFDLRMGIIL